MHADPMQGVEPTPPNGPDSFLSAGGQDASSPDARLDFYRRACAALSERSNSGSGSCCCAAGEEAGKWVSLLLPGTQDPWSAVRSLCIDHLGQLLFLSTSSDTAVAVVVPLLDRLAAESWPAAVASGGGAWYAREGLLRVYRLIVRNSSSSGNKMNTKTDGNAAVAALHDHHHHHQQQYVLEVMRAVALPSLEDPQLPVREQAARLLSLLASYPANTNRSSDDSSSSSGSGGCCSSPAEAAVSAVVARLTAVAAVAPSPAAAGSPPQPKDEDITRVVEGYLLALLKLIECSDTTNNTTRTSAGNEGSSTHGAAAVAALLKEERCGQELDAALRRLASYPASSVRQYVAEALGRHSDGVFLSLLQGLCGVVTEKEKGEGTGTEASTGGASGFKRDNNDGGDGDAWQATETVLLALQHHLVRYLGSSSGNNGVNDGTRGCGGGVSRSGSMPLGSALAAAVRCAASARFEVARMGAQVAPLLLQLWVRSAAGVDHVLLAVAQTLVADDEEGREGRDSLLRGLVAPMLWWFAAIRSAVEGREEPQEDEDGSGSGSSGGRDRASVISAEATAAWRALLTAHESEMVATRLAIAAYYRPDSFHGEDNSDGGFYAVVTRPLLDEAVWRAALLSAPSNNKKSSAAAAAAWALPWGLDFIASPAAAAGGSSTVLARLVPAWMAALPALMTHQQCILLSMVRAALSPPPRRAHHRPLSFVYHPAVYAAPVTLDGGEDTILGYTWLRAHFPTEDSLPLRGSGGEAVEEKEEGEEVGVVTAAVVAAVANGCRRVYASREVVVEPVVLRECRAVLVALARCGGGGAAAALEVLLARLDTFLGPQWWLQVEDGGGETEDTTATATIAADGGWDDWDDDDDDGNGAVEGVCRDDEVREAANAVRQTEGWLTLLPLAAAELPSGREKLARLTGM